MCIQGYSHYLIWDLEKESALAGASFSGSRVMIRLS